MVERFNSKLVSIMKSKKSNSGFLTRDKYDDLLKKVSDSKNKSSGKKPEDYQRLKRYDVMKVGDTEKLIFPISKDSSSVRFYVYFEELFPIIHETHLSIGHGGRNRMLKELQKKYKNITTEEVMIYLNLCEICQKKSKVPKKGLVVRPMVFQEMNSRCQVDLIDMQSQPDNDFKFIFVYQDHLTKFVQLRALKSKRAEEVAYHLIDIFTIFGAPSVLQSDNGREFSNRIIEEACSMWSDLKIVHGKPRHSQTQGSVERANQDIENMLSSWLESNQTCKWSEGLRFVQFMKNRAFHEGIKCTPYEAMFGTPVKVGLKTSSFPNDSIEHLRTEEELQALIDTVKASENTNSDDDSDMDNNDSSQNVYLPAGNFESQGENEPEGPSTQADIFSRQKEVRKKRMSAKEGLVSQANKMLKISNLKFPAGKVGDTVKLRVPDVDRARSDPRNLLAVILEVQNGEFYQLGTKQGRLSQLYTRNQFTICEEKFILLDDVPDLAVSLRECVRKSSLSGGQGYQRCVCKGHCKSDKCKCRKSGKLCNSKCHNSLTCLNK